MDNKLFETVNGEDLEFSPALQKAYVDFINEAFGFNESGEDFKKLLPKLFGETRSTCRTATFAFEKSTGRIAACAGRFPVKLSISWKEFKAFGIGNVCCRKDLREQGLMSAVMREAVEKMIKDGAALSFLGGMRQRYNHFGIETCGTRNSYHVLSKTLKNLTLGAKGVEILPVTGSDIKA
ncbi:MAG: GNAT family N-acetyltransferase, partial [Clostridia bacterium]|nr:GNAT family N-acetyltransferase [Clostridia bacterium]